LDRQHLSCATFLAVAIISLLVGAVGGGLAGAGVSALLSWQSPRTATLTHEQSSPSQPTSLTYVTLDEESAVIRAVEKATPSVVTIESTIIAYSLFFQPIPETGVGSGLIIDPNGFILTNRHVVEDAKALNVTFSTKETHPGRYPAKLIGLDPITDLAIIKVDLKELPAVEIGDSSKLRIGQMVIAIGSPLGTYKNSVTTGVVSALGRTVRVASSSRSGGAQDIYELIQTDAAINQGNSGGPLIILLVR